MLCTLSPFIELRYKFSTKKGHKIYLLKHSNTETHVCVFVCFTLSTNQLKSIKNKLPKTQRLKCQKPQQSLFITYGQILIENATQKEFRR